MKNSTSPLLIAHRGERRLSPENTITACRLALQQGATGLEVDLRQCADGKLVVFHDSSLKRNFGLSRPVRDCSFDELKQLTFRGDYQYDDRICSLREFLAVFKNTVPINLDLKGSVFRRNSMELVLVDIVREFDLYEQVWMSSFNPMIIKRLKAIDRKIRTGYLFQNPTMLHEVIDRGLNSDAWHPHFKNVNQRLINKARRLGKEIYVWTVNDETILNKVLSFEVEGIITDRFFRQKPLK